MGYDRVRYHDRPRREVTIHSNQPNGGCSSVRVEKNHRRKRAGFATAFPCCPAEYLVTSCAPENTVAQRLYQSFGFAETGDVDEEDGELIAAMKL